MQSSRLPVSRLADVGSCACRLRAPVRGASSRMYAASLQEKMATAGGDVTTFDPSVEVRPPLVGAVTSKASMQMRRSCP